MESAVRSLLADMAFAGRLRDSQVPSVERSKSDNTQGT